MNRLSACLITLNEERNLPRALRSLEGVADEIIVVDCGSQDRTQEIAQAYKAKAIIREWTDFAQQKNFAAASASGNCRRSWWRRAVRRWRCAAGNQGLRCMMWHGSACAPGPPRLCENCCLRIPSTSCISMSLTR